MKKKLSITAIVLGIFSFAIGGLMKWKNPISVSVIDHSDGPTSVFLAGKLGPDYSWLFLILGAATAIFGLFSLKKKK